MLLALVWQVYCDSSAWEMGEVETKEAGANGTAEEERGLMRALHSLCCRLKCVWRVTVRKVTD